jgi:hypothetical protein
MRSCPFESRHLPGKTLKFGTTPAGTGAMRRTSDAQLQHLAATGKGVAVGTRAAMVLIG